MATMGKYCKAYSLKKLREFSGWTEKAENARKEKHEDGTEGDSPRVFTDDAYLYLQENYMVTDDIFKDEYIIFDNVTPEWIEYCQQVLQFDIPDYARTRTLEPKEHQH